MSSRTRGLVESAKKRTEAVQKRLRSAYRSIELEIEKNEGIYPLNGGRLSEAEVCRRAAVSPITLLGEKHKETRKELKQWLDGIRRRTVTGAATVRREVTKRADDWKAAYMEIADRFHLCKLQEIGKNERLQVQEARIAELESLVRELQAELSRGKVTPIRKTRCDTLSAE